MEFVSVHLWRLAIIISPVGDGMTGLDRPDNTHVIWRLLEHGNMSAGSKFDLFDPSPKLLTL